MNVYLAEAIGTMILLILGDGVVANVLLSKSKGQHGGWMVITTAWGLAVIIAIFCVGRISGAHLNPAVTVSLAAVGLRCAPLMRPTQKMAMMTANPHAVVITIQPPCCPLDLLSNTFATTPSPRIKRIIVPMASDR